MARKPPFARIAITLPPETLRAADELAAQHDRSRSWIVAEAIRQYAAAQRGAPPADGVSARLGRSRLEQLRRDVALSPEARVLESEELVAIGGELPEPVSPRTFASFDAFLAWRREREAR
jgi:hypothetical protein